MEANFGEIVIEIYAVSFKKMHLKMSYRKFYLGLNVLTTVDGWKSVVMYGWKITSIARTWQMIAWQLGATAQMF